MRQYSQFFTTLYDETTAVAPMGRGCHYSVVRIFLQKPEPHFRDVAIIWDDDHDTRVVEVLERMIVQEVLGSTIFVGERKGGLTVITKAHADLRNHKTMDGLSCVETDDFDVWMEVWPDVGGIISDHRSQAYLTGINALWELGKKPCVVPEVECPFGWAMPYKAKLKAT